MTITTKAYAHIPGFADLTEAEQRVNDALADNRKRKFDAPVSSEDFADAALSGTAFPEEPHRHNERIRNERLDATVRGDMLKNAFKSIGARRLEIIREHSDEALAYLAGELTTLMQEVRSVATTLGSVHTAEHVLDANDPKLLTAWRSRDELIARYSEIRSVQHGLTAAGLGQGESFQINAVGHVRNSLEQSDYWLSKRERSTSHRAANDQLSGVRNFDAWLGAGGTATFKHSNSAIPSTDTNGNPVNPWDYLVWLATTAEPWIPSAADLVAAFNSANLAVAETDYKKYPTQEAGRSRFFEVTGVRPLVPFTNSATDKPEIRRVKRPTSVNSAARSMGL